MSIVEAVYDEWERLAWFNMGSCQHSQPPHIEASIRQARFDKYARPLETKINMLFIDVVPLCAPV